MSSATSIKSGGVRVKPEAADTPPPEAPSDVFRPWHFFVLAALAMATVAVIMSRGSTPEHLILISVTILCAGGAAAAFHRMLAPLAGHDPSALADPLSDRARHAIQREKALVLRSIKELEFDRSMGKLSQKDFEEMAGRLRNRAVTLMKQLDEGSSGYREIIERELLARLGPRAAAARAAEPPAAQSVTPPAAPVAEAGACVACGATNDSDAAFCKRCGTKLVVA